MKKFLALILASLLVVSFAACSKKEDENTNNNSNNTAAPSESTYNEFRYSVNASGDYDITGFISNGTDAAELTVPAEISGRPVTGIAAPTSAPSRFLTR